MATGSTRGQGMTKPVPAGARFGRYTVIEVVSELRGNPGKQKKTRLAICHCDCGTEKKVELKSLRNGKVVSCGCHQREASSACNRTHGGARTPLYHIWRQMKWRCSDPRAQRYHRYGARGISVCPEWESSFEAFRGWALAHGYQPGLSIERKNNDGNYEPSNCTWITVGEQSKNMRRNRRHECFGESKVLSEWARDPRCAVAPCTLGVRLNAGWDFERALTTPPGVRRP